MFTELVGGAQPALPRGAVALGYILALRSLLAAQGIQAEPDGADQLLAVGITTEAVGRTAAAAAGIVIYEVSAERSNLEDVFLQLTSQQGARS